MQTEKNFTNKTRKRKGNFTGNEELSKKPRKDIYNKTHTPVNNSNQSENYNDVFEDKNILNVNNNSDTSSDDCEIVSVSLNNNGQLLSKYRKIDVPGDNSCLFWAVTLAYLTPVKDDHNIFKTRFQKLFGHQNQLSTIQKCIQKYDHNIPNNDILKNLVTQDFRNMVCDYIADNKKRFNFQDLLFNKSSNDELNYKELESHIQQMRKTTTWGTCLEQEAMALMLACNIHTYSNAQTHQVYPIVNKKTYDDKLILHFVNAETKNYDTKSANHFMFSLLNNSYILEHINDKQADSDDAVSSVIEVDLESSNSEIKSQLGNDNESKASNIVPLLFPEPTNECDVFDIHNHSIFKYYSKLAINAKISNLSSLGTTSRPYYSKDYIILIKHYLKLGFLDSAFELYSVLGKYYTGFESEEIELSIGKMYARIGKYSKAREYYNKITDSYFIDKAKILIGNSFFQENKYDDAIEYYQKIPESYTKSQSMLDLKRYCQSRINIGNSYLKKSNYEVARYYYDIVSNRLAKNDDYYYRIYNKAQIGNAYTWLKKGDHQSAQKYYDKIKQIDYDDVILRVGNILIKNNKYAQAREWLEQINENSPCYAPSQILIGNIFFYEGKYLQAREHYDNIQEKRKGEYYYCMAQINIGRSFIKENKFEEAKKYFNEIPSSSHFYKLDSKSSDTEAPYFNPYSKFKSYKHNIKDKLLCDQVVEFIKRKKSNDSEDMSNSSDTICDNYESYVINNIDNSNSEQENDQKESTSSEEESTKDINDNEGNNIARISPNNDGTIAISSTESTEYILSRNKKALDVLISEVKNYSPELSELWKSLSPEIGNQPIYKKLEAFFLDPLHILQVNTDKKQEQNVPDKQKDQAQIGLSKSCNISNTSIPPNFVEGIADNKGDCFFDAIAQALKQIKPEIDCSIKSLRKTCYEFMALNYNTWFQEMIKSDNNLANDVPRIQFTAADIATNTDSAAISILNLKEPIWGRPEIEGRIICEKYNVRLHVQELHNIEGKIIFIDQIIDQCGSKTTDIDYTQNDIIHIKNNGRAHFIPLLRSKINNNDVELTTNQNSAQREIGLSNNQIIDKKNHTTVKRVLNFEKSVSKTTNLDKSHNININSVQNTIISKETLGIQYDVPADGNCLFWSIFYAYLLPVRRSHEEFKARFKKMFPDRSDLHNVSSLQNKFQSLELNNLNTQVKDFIPLIQELRKRAYDEVANSADKDQIHVTPSKKGKSHQKWANEMKNAHYDNDGKIPMNYWGEEKAINALAYLLDIKITEQHSHQHYPYNLSNPLNKNGHQNLILVKSNIEIILLNTGEHYNFYCKDIQWDKVDNNLDDTHTSKMEDTVKIILSEYNYSRKEESTYDEFDNNGKTIAANSHKRKQKSDQEENTCTTIEVYKSKHSNNDLHDFENKKYKLLHDAAREGDISAVKDLLIKGTDVNALDHKGWTVLHYAARDGYDDIVKLLLEYGANVNAKNPNGWTALHLAAYNIHIPIIYILLKYRADINITNNYEYTPLNFIHLKIYHNKEELRTSITAKHDKGYNHETKSYFIKIVKLRKIFNLKLKHINDHNDLVQFLVIYDIMDIHINAQRSILIKEGLQNTPLDIQYSNKVLNVEVIINKLLNNTDKEKLLHLAATEKGYSHVVAALLTKGIDVNALNHNGWTALHLASRNGYDDIVKLLLNYGADVNILNNQKWTALHLAARNGYEEIVKLLLEYDASIINTQNSNGSTALHLALMYKHEKVVQILLKKEADINITDNDGYTCSHYSIQEKNGKIKIDINNICLAAKIRDISAVKDLLIKGTDVNVLDHKGWTVLHYAARDGYDDIVKLLLNYGADVNILNNQKWTALHLAARNGYEEIVKLLLEYDASIINTQNSNGSTALHLALMYKHEKVVQILLKKEADINITDNDGYTCSHYSIQEKNGKIKIDINNICLAAKIRDISAVKDLLIKGTDVNVLDHKGWTVLHYAARDGYDDIVKLLLNYGADVNILNNQKWTALHLAARNGYEEIVKLLLEYDASIINTQNSNGSTALHLALMYKHEKVVQILLKKEADINITDNDGYTYSHYSIQEKNGKIKIDINNICLAAKIRDISAVKDLLIKGIDVNALNHNGWTALHLASRNGYDDIVKLLLNYGADVNILNNQKWTALHLAARNGYEEIVKLLLEYDASIINTQNSNGSTALHLASMYKHKKVVKVLLDNELINTDINDNNGDTPYNLALIKYYCLDIINLFQSKQHPSETGLLKTNNTVISDNLEDCGLKFNQILNRESLPNFQQPALHEKQDLNAHMYTQDEKVMNIFYKKIKKYKFEKWNIDIEIREVQHSYFLIEELYLKRICTKNEGNHILPVSTICNLIKKFIEISKKNLFNDYIKVAEKLLSTFVSNTHIHGEIQAYYNHLRDMMLNKKREKLSTINDLKVFLEHNLIPFILYVWDNRITSNFYEKRTKKALGQEGANIKLVNQKIMTLFNNENSELQQYQVQMQSIQKELLSTIDLPIIITHGLEELKRKDDIDKYFNCILLFLVKNLIVTIKNGTYANTLLYMEELKASIKSFKNLDNNSPLKDLQKIVGINNEQSTLDIEHKIEKIKSHCELNNSIFNIIRILEAIHIENNINEVLQDQSLHFIYGIYINFIEKKNKSNLIKIRDNVESYKQKLESEPSIAVNDKCVLESKESLTTILEIIKVWNEYSVDVRLGDNEQQSIRNIVQKYLDSIAYDIVKLLHICTSVIECTTSISHYECDSEYTNIRNNLLKITSCAKELIEYHSNDISNLRREMLTKICEELSDNDYSVYLSSDTGSVQDNHSLSDNDIAEQQEMVYPQFALSLQKEIMTLSYSINDVMILMQRKWKEEKLRVFSDKASLLEAVKNKHIKYVIFIQKDENSGLVGDARIIITESNEEITEIPIVVQDKTKIDSFFKESDLAEYITSGDDEYNHISSPISFYEVVYKLFYHLDKPEKEKNIREVITIDCNLPCYENNIISILSDKIEAYVKQINKFLKKLDKNKIGYDEFAAYLKENSVTQIMGKTIEQHYKFFIKINPGFIKALKLNSIIQYCNEHSGLENVQDFIKQIQTTLKEKDVYKGIDYVEATGLDLESIRHNIHMINQDINQTVVDIDNNRMQLLFNNTNCLKILGIKDYQDGNHAIVVVKNTNSVSIIDPLNKNSSFSNSLEKLANNLLNLGIKFINIIYSGLQQPNSGVCADISLILVKNLADKLQDVQSVQDIIEIIQDIRIEMYGKASEKNQEAITIKSFDAINTLTKLDSCAVGIQDKEKQQDNYYANNEFINTLQQDVFLIKPVELIGNVL